MKPIVDQKRYQDEGVLIGLPILSQEEVGAFSDLYERLEAANRSGKRLTNRHHDVPELWDLVRRQRIIDTMTALLGPDLVLISSGFFSKAAHSDHDFVDWHQDTMYWGLEPPLAHTLWIALDDSTPDNGCMRVIPRSHQHGLVPHTTSTRQGNLLSRNQAIAASSVDEEQAVDCVLAAGEASIHHGMLIHGSNPNTSGRRRCGMTLRFTTPDVRPVQSGPHPFQDRPLLIAGRDRFGHFQYATTPFS